MEFCDRFYRDNRERIQVFLLHLTGDYDLARDLVQESFTRYLSRYGRDTGNLALLYTIARNAALDTFRKRRESQGDRKRRSVATAARKAGSSRNRSSTRCSPPSGDSTTSTGN